MTSDEIRNVINDTVKTIVERDRDLKVIFTDSNSQVLGGMNKRSNNSIEIHSFMPEHPIDKRRFKDFIECDRCKHADKMPEEYPCSICTHNSLDKYSPKVEEDENA